MSDAFLRSLMLGSGRGELQPPESLRHIRDARGDAWLLPTIAMLGQQLRYRRLQVPAIDEDAGLPPAPQPIVVEAARAPLLQLFGKDGADEVSVLAVRYALRANGLRLHPFDFARLAPLLNVADDLRTPQERAFVKLDQQGEPEDDAPSEVTRDNWEQFGPRTRLAFLATVRAADPADGRELLTEALGNAPAATRAVLLEALAIGLSDDDRPLLEQQLGGRAESVRKVADALLARLPDTEQSRDLIATLAKDIRTGKSGLIRRQKTFAWRKTDRRTNRVADAVHALLGVDLDALAAELDVKVTDLVAGSANDPALTTALLGAALTTERSDFAALAAKAGESDVLQLLHVFGADPRRSERVRALVTACMRPEEWSQLPTPYAFAELHETLEGPLPETVAASLLGSSSLASALRRIAREPMEAPDRHLLEPLAALTPAPCRPQLREHLDKLALGDRQRAVLLLDLLDLLDNQTQR